MFAIESHDGVRVVRLGDGLNAFDAAFVDDLDRALDAVEADEAATVLVTTAGGKHYSNGFDLEFLGGLSREGALAYLDRVAATLARVLTFPLPTVAALNGHAFGAGAMLALAHDRRVANAERGWFCLPEVDLGMQFLPFQLALITSRLPALVAEEAILTGSRYDGTAAVAAGIAQATVPPTDLLTEAVRLATPYAGKQRGSVQALKVQLHAATLALLPPPPE